MSPGLLGCNGSGMLCFSQRHAETRDGNTVPNQSLPNRIGVSPEKRSCAAPFLEFQMLQRVGVV